ncbi:hypothetical protein FC831_10725 [Clostridium botulinum]|nr:hypothetical protein [Clostridium botulinum]
MKNEQLVLFNNEEVKVITDKGATLINLANSARVLGLARKDDGRICWKGNRSVYDKLSKIRSSLVNSTGATNAAENILEIDYILSEIENTDDRNSIYMSQMLTSLLAMNCNNDKAMQYKSWLAQLDEKYSKGELTNGNQIEQLGNIANQINLVASTMGQIGQAFIGLEEFVKDSIQVKDSQIDDIKALVGFKSCNTKRIVCEIKSKLGDLLGGKIYATSPMFKEVKRQIFLEFHVTKWEDIPIEKYKKVHNYVDTLFSEKIINDSIKAVD